MRYFIAALAVTMTLCVMAQDRDYEDTPRGQFQQCIRESQPNPHPNLGRITVNRTQMLKSCKKRVEDTFRQTFSLQELTGIFDAGVEAAKALANANIVSFNFDWPSGINAIVETSNISRKSLDGIEVVVKTDSRIRLTTERRRRGIAVRWHDSKSEVEILPEEQGPANIVVQKLIAQVVELSPDVLVNSKGELTKVDKPKKVQEQADKLFLDAAATLRGHFKEDDLAMLRRMIADLSSPERLRARASARWDLEVGQWHGVELGEGIPIRIDTELTLTALGDFIVNGSNEYVLEGRVACNTQDTDKKCVKMIVHSTLQPGALDHINAKLGEGVVATEVINVHDLSLVIEPETLLPHRIEETLLRKFVFAGKAEGLKPQLQSEKRVTQYRYTGEASDLN